MSSDNPYKNMPNDQFIELFESNGFKIVKGTGKILGKDEINNEITYDKTWYKYPETNPSMLKYFDEYKFYEICWHWIENKYKHISQGFYDKEKKYWFTFNYYDGVNPNDMEEINFEYPIIEGKKERRIIEAWSEIIYPKFNND